MFLRLYKQFVRVHLEFSVVSWSPWTQADIMAIETVQIRALNMVAGLKGQTYEAKLLEVGMSSLEDRWRRFDIIQTYKMINRVDEINSRVWFQINGNNQTAHTRNRVCRLNKVKSGEKD